MTSLAEQFAHSTAVLGGDLWGGPTEAEMRRMDAESDAARLRCALHRDDTACGRCCHNDCDWCPTCNPGDTR